jgi:hypothetical protein
MRAHRDEDALAAAEISDLVHSEQVFKDLTYRRVPGAQLDRTLADRLIAQLIESSRMRRAGCSRTRRGLARPRDSTT